MSYISNNSIVSRQEAEALKEMIFKRVKERAEAIEQQVNSSYTSDVQADIMDVARASFETKKNPFAQIIESTPTNETKETPEIGFAQRKVNPVQKQIVNKNSETNAEITKAIVEETMATASNDLTRKKTFMGALEFLNSQATITLVNKRAKSFEALA